MVELYVFCDMQEFCFVVIACHILDWKKKDNSRYFCFLLFFVCCDMSKQWMFSTYENEFNTCLDKKETVLQQENFNGEFLILKQM